MKQATLRKDGRCRQCGGPRRDPPKTKYISRAIYEMDPFCSRICSETFWQGKSQAGPNRRGTVVPGKMPTLLRRDHAAR